MKKRVGSCLRCGHCCKAVYLNFGMGHASTEKERVVAKDFLRWAALHEGVIVRWIDEDTAEVGYNTPCKRLEFNEDSKSSCAIYEDRPEICRRYPDVENPNCPGFKFVEDPDIPVEGGS